jgi:hypothetical protein
MCSANHSFAGHVALRQHLRTIHKEQPEAPNERRYAVAKDLPLDNPSYSILYRVLSLSGFVNVRVPVEFPYETL